MINQHPAVLLSAVVGRQIAGNEEVIAFVQCEPETDLTEAGLKAFIAERLAPYKRPSQMIFMDALPATATGKILKGKLKVMAPEAWRPTLKP